MSTDNKNQSLAQNASLTESTWGDFVSRLRHDCVGKGVENHCTADAIFIVQKRKIISGIDRDYTDNVLVYCDGCHWFSPQEYWNDLDVSGRVLLNKKAKEEHNSRFLWLNEEKQWDILSALDDHTVTGWDESWEYVSAHLTNDAAEAFISRKIHDYKEGMRIFVESQCFAWEFNTIKNAILDGRISFNDSK